VSPLSHLPPHLDRYLADDIKTLNEPETIKFLKKRPDKVAEFLKALKLEKNQDWLKKQENQQTVHKIIKITIDEINSTDLVFRIFKISTQSPIFSNCLDSLFQKEPNVLIAYLAHFKKNREHLSAYKGFVLHMLEVAILQKLTMASIEPIWTTCISDNFFSAIEIINLFQKGIEAGHEPFIKHVLSSIDKGQVLDKDSPWHHQINKLIQKYKRHISTSACLLQSLLIYCTEMFKQEELNTIMEDTISECGSLKITFSLNNDSKVELLESIIEFLACNGAKLPDYSLNRYSSLSRSKEKQLQLACITDQAKTLSQLHDKITALSTDRTELFFSSLKELEILNFIKWLTLNSQSKEWLKTSSVTKAQFIKFISSTKGHSDFTKLFLWLKQTDSLDDKDITDLFFQAIRRNNGSILKLMCQPSVNFLLSLSLESAKQLMNEALTQGKWLAIEALAAHCNSSVLRQPMQDNHSLLYHAVMKHKWKSVAACLNNTMFHFDFLFKQELEELLFQLISQKNKRDVDLSIEDEQIVTQAILKLLEQQDYLEPQIYDGKENNLLHAVILTCDNSLIKYFLEKTIPNKCLDKPNKDRQKPLALAYQESNFEIACLLIDAGANPNTIIDDEGNTLLHTAFKNGNFEQIRILLCLGANLKFTNYHNERPQDLNPTFTKEVSSLLEKYHCDLLPPKKQLEALTTPRHIAHILGDSFIKDATDDQGNRLEGNSIEDSIRFVLAILKNLPTSLKSKKLIEDFENCLQIARMINYPTTFSAAAIQEDLQQNIIPLISHKIRRLSPSQNLLLPIGWADDHGMGHAMLCEIQYTQLRQIVLRILNTGSGAEYHPFSPRANKSKIAPVITFEGLSKTQVSNEQFLQALFELKIAPWINKQAGLYYSADDLYMGIFARFKDYQSNKDLGVIDNSLVITAQRSGTCSVRCLMAYIRLCLGKDRYKELKHKMAILVAHTAFNLYQETLASQPKLKRLLVKGSENVARHFNFFLKVGNVDKDLLLIEIKLIKNLLDNLKQIVQREETKNKLFITPLETLNTQTAQLQQNIGILIENLSSSIFLEQIIFQEPTLNIKHYPKYNWSNKDLSGAQILGDLEYVLHYCQQCQSTNAPILNQKDFLEGMVTEVLLNLPLPKPFENNASTSQNDFWSQLKADDALKVQKVLSSLLLYALYNIKNNPHAYFSRIIAFYKALVISYRMGCLVDSKHTASLHSLDNLNNYTLFIGPLISLQKDLHNLAYYPILEKQLNNLIEFIEKTSSSRKTALFNFDNLPPPDNSSIVSFNFPFPTDSGEFLYLKGLMDRCQEQIDWSLLPNKPYSINDCNDYEWRIAHLWCNQVPNNQFNLPIHYIHIRQIGLLCYLLCRANEEQLAKAIQITEPLKQGKLFSFEIVNLSNELNSFSFKANSKSPDKIVIRVLNPYLEINKDGLLEIHKFSNTYEKTHLPLSRTLFNQPSKENALISCFKQNEYHLKVSQELIPFYSISNQSTLTIHRVIQHFKENPVELKDFENQAFFNLTLFRNQLLLKELELYPSSREFLSNFLNQGLAESKLLLTELSKSSSVLAQQIEAAYMYLFFSQTKFRVLNYFIELQSGENAIFEEQQIKLKEELEAFIEGKARFKVFQEEEIGQAARITWLSSYIYTYSTITYRELQLLIAYTAFTYLHAKCQCVIDPTIRYETRKIIIKQAEMIRELLKDSQIRQNIFKATLYSVHGIIIPSKIYWNEKFPIYSCSYRGNIYEINVLSGATTCDGIELSSLNQIYNFSEYKHIFGEQRFPSAKVATIRKNPVQTLYTVVNPSDGKKVKFLHSQSNTANKPQNLQIELTINGINYTYIPYELFSDTIDWPHLSLQPNKEHYLLWLCKDLDDPHLLLTERSDNRIVFKITKNGQILETTDDNINKKYEWANVDDLDRHQILGNFEKSKFITAFLGTSPPYLTLTFNRYRDAQGLVISFERKNIKLDHQESDLRMIWVANPQYFISAKQEIKELNSFSRFLVLEDAHGESKALIPLLTWNDLCNRNHVDDSPKYLNSTVYHCELINLSKHKRLKPISILQKLFCAYIYLSLGQDLKALDLLKTCHHLQRYTGEELRLFSWLVHSSEETLDYSPNTLAIQLYATYLVHENLSKFPLGRGNKDLSSFQIETPYAPVREWEMYWDGIASWGGFTSLQKSPKPNIDHTVSLYENYLAVRKNVDASFRIEASMKNSIQQRSALLTKQEEIQWLLRLIDLTGNPQLIERALALVESSESLLPSSKGNGAKSGIFFGGEFDKKVEEAKLKFTPELFIYKFRSTKLADKKLEATQTLRTIFPRTRPGKQLTKYFANFYLLAIEGNSTQKNELLEFLFDMRCDPDSNNQAIRLILESLIRNDLHAINIRKILELAFARGCENSSESLIQDLNSILKNIASARKDDKLIYNKNLEERLATLSRIPLPQPNQSYPDPKDRIQLHAKLLEPYSSDLGRLIESYAAEYVSCNTCFTPHKELKLSPPANEFEKIKHLELLDDYQEGCIKNDTELHYTICTEKLEKLGFLQKELSSALNSHNQIQQKLKKVILDCINQIPSPYSVHGLWKVEQRKLKLISQQSKQLSFSDCQAAFAQQSYSAFKQLNPYLTDNAIESINLSIIKYLLSKAESKRAIHILNLMQTCERFQISSKDISITADLANSEVYEELATELSKKRCYNPYEFPAYLLFEARMGGLLKPDQVESLKLFLSTEETNGIKYYPHHITQKIMGGGKTLVLGTLLSLMKADGYHLSILVPPSSLYNTNAQDMQNRSNKLFGQKAHTIVYDRAPEKFTIFYLRSIYSTLVRAINFREYIITPPETIQSMRNKYIESREQLRKLYELRSFYKTLAREGLAKNIDIQIMDLEAPVQILKSILSLIKERGVGTLDEIDAILQTRKELNYPLGAKTPLNRYSIELLGELFYIAALDPDIAPILQLKENKQSHHTFDKEYDRIKNLITIKLLNHLKKSLKWVAILHLDGENYQKALSYILQTDTTIPKFISDLYESGLKSKQQAANLLILLHQQLNEGLKGCWKRNVDQHFGRSMINPKKQIAIPYVASNTPNETAEFSNPWEIINKTYHLYICKGLDISQTIKLVELQQQQARQQWQDSDYFTLPAETSAAQLFLEATGKKLFHISTDDLTTIAEIQKSLLNSSEASLMLILRYVSEQILPEVGIYTQQIFNHAHHLCSSLKTVQGYSGTLENKHTFPTYLQKNIELEKGTIGKVIDLLLRKNNRIHHLKSSNPKEIFNEVLLNHADAPLFHALIDAGAYFKGIRNQKVNELILDFYNEHSKLNRPIQGVLSYDETTNLLAAIKSGERKVKLLPATDARTITSVTGLQRAQLFTYYDQRHTTGSDIAQIAKAKAITTIGENLTLRDLLQAVMRMRQLGKRQNVEFTIACEVLPVLAKTLEPKEIPNKISIEDIIAFVVKNEAARQAKDCVIATLQDMQAIVTNYVLQRMYACSEKEGEKENALYAKARSLFIRDDLLDLYQKALSKKQNFNPYDFLHEECFKLLEIVLPGFVRQGLGNSWKLSSFSVLIQAIENRFNSNCYIKDLVEQINSGEKWKIAFDWSIDKYTAIGKRFSEFLDTNMAQDLLQYIGFDIAKMNLAKFSYIADALLDCFDQKQLLLELISSLEIILSKARITLPNNQEILEENYWNTEFSVEHQQEVSYDQNHQQEIENHRQLEIEQQVDLQFKPATEVYWKVKDLCLPENELLAPLSYPKESDDRPTIWSLQDILGTIPHLSPYSCCFNPNINVSKNFVESLENEINLFCTHQKPLYEVLVSYHNSLQQKDLNPWRITFISLQEAAFFKVQLRKKKDASIKTPLWLLEPDQTLIAEGKYSWTEFSSKSKFNLDMLFIETLFFTANLTKLNSQRWLPLFADWSQKNGFYKRILFEVAILSNDKIKLAIYQQSQVSATLNKQIRNQNYFEQEQAEICILASKSQKFDIAIDHLSKLQGQISKLPFSTLSPLLSVVLEIIKYSRNPEQRVRAETYFSQMLEPILEGIARNELQPVKTIISNMKRSVNSIEVAQSLQILTVKLGNKGYTQEALEITDCMSTQFKQSQFEDSNALEQIKQIRKLQLTAICMIDKKTDKKGLDKVIANIMSVINKEPTLSKNVIKEIIEDIALQDPSAPLNNLEPLWIEIHQELFKIPSLNGPFKKSIDEVRKWLQEVSIFTFNYAKFFPEAYQKGLSCIKEFANQAYESSYDYSKNTPIYRYNKTTAEAIPVIQALIEISSDYTIELAQQIATVAENFVGTKDKEFLRQVVSM
jgi:hypothetical protein